MSTSQNFPPFSSGTPNGSQGISGLDLDAVSQAVAANEPIVSETATSEATETNMPESVSLIPNNLNPIKTLRVLRSIGYGLLLLSFIDLLYIIFPPEFTKPIWEYQTIGDLVRLIPVPMLAFMFVFYGETVGRKKIERPIIKILSWSTLILGIFCILLIPLTVVNTMRIGQYNNEQINTQVNQQKLQLDNTKVRLENATPDQLQQLIQGQDAKDANAPKTAQEAKSKVLNNLQTAQAKADEQAATARKNVQQNLMKNSVKIVLESLVGGFLFLYTWFVTDWARRRQADAYESVDQNGKPVPLKQKSLKSRRLRR